MHGMCGKTKGEIMVTINIPEWICEVMLYLWATYLIINLISACYLHRLRKSVKALKDVVSDNTVLKQELLEVAE